ncbi:hypothetical protein [Elizabethkingia anophelis]|uniref:hypothetical protein n=1 Tax=Elizabethkingia anophelis TaxID=1117645 RepID=UPI003891C463
MLDGLSKLNKSKIDLSNGNLDGNHTIALRDGEKVGYQELKKCKTINALYFADRQGLPLAMSKLISDNHYDIELHYDEIINTLQHVTVSIDGLFMNADAGFDAKNLCRICQQKRIIANIVQNKRNSDMDNELYFDH